jgi:hypothetical protein
VKPTILGIYPAHKMMRTRTSLEVVTTGRRILDLEWKGGRDRIIEVKVEEWTHRHIGYTWEPLKKMIRLKGELNNNQ